MNVRNPKVSVLMPVYNGEEYLHESIESILNQTFRDFEFLIISEHGTSDESLAIIQSYSDERIRHIHNATRLGLVGSLNLGLKEAKGEYIARMDADDISYKTRFEKQVNYLDMHPEVGILGTQCRVIDSNGRNIEYIHQPINDLRIRWIILLGCPFAHPTVMLRQNVIFKNKLNYEESAERAEDYELWTRLLKYTRGANLREPLVQYRKHPANSSIIFRSKQLEVSDIVALRTIKEQLPGYAETFGYVEYFRKTLICNNKLMPSLATQRIALAEEYLDMFDAFVSHHQEETDLKSLQCNEAVMVAYFIRYSLLQSGFIHIFWRLMTMNSIMPLLVIVFLSKAIIRRFKNKLKF